MLASSLEIAHPTQAAFYGGAFSIGVLGQNDGLENIPNGGEDNDMFLKQRREGHLVEVAEIQELINPLRKSVKGRLHYGEEMQEPEIFQKEDLVFPSGEFLPRCWTMPPAHHN